MLESKLISSISKLDYNRMNMYMGMMANKAGTNMAKANPALLIIGLYFLLRKPNDWKPL
tara:strand:- start:17 stop:193 length:177 start_codon:yes stop_codon:yes gene_type:complete